MCYKGKCLFCIPVEHGCLVFAVLSAIGTLIALLACLAMGLLALAGIVFVSEMVKADTGRPSHSDLPFLTDDNRHEVASRLEIFGGMAVSIVTLVTAIPTLLGFIFSVLLCNGICKSRPGQVQAYFIYGVMITVLAVVAAIIHMCNNSDQLPGVYTLLGCVVYSLCLWMVYETYLKLTAGADIKDHIRLVESY